MKKILIDNLIYNISNQEAKELDELYEEAVNSSYSEESTKRFNRYCEMLYKKYIRRREFDEISEIYQTFK